MQLASVGAQVLVTEMTKSTWAGLRDRLAKVFHRDSNTSRHLDMADIDQQALVHAAEDDREAIESRLLSRWQLQLAAFLDQYPEAGDDLLELIESSAESRNQNGQHKFAAFGNTESQIVQAAGDIRTGGGDISFTRPQS